MAFDNDRRIKMINTANTGRGTVFDKHKEYDVSERTAEVFIMKGHAVDAFEHYCEILQAVNAGLYVTEDTDPRMAEAADRAGIRVSKARKRKAGPKEGDA